MNRPPAQTSENARRNGAARVLIVEDEALVALMLSDLVDDAGMVAIGPAATAREALRIADAERPAVAIVDVSLQGAREGLQVGVELERRGIALIFVSGHSDVAKWPELRSMTPVAVLRKPCPPDQIIRALEVACERQPDRLALEE